MGTFRITVEIGDQRFQELEALVDTGAPVTKVPCSILEALDIPAARTYTALLADGRRAPREQGWTTIRLEGQQFPTPAAFGWEGEPILPGRVSRKRGKPTETTNMTADGRRLTFKAPA